MRDAVPAPYDAVRAEVHAALLSALRGAGSSLVDDSFIERELLDQVDGILAATFERLGLDTGAKAPGIRGESMGNRRARQHVHPVDSLKAATELFDVALSAITREPAIDADPGDVARALNVSIMESVIPASVAYVNVLLERLAVAHSEERLGISRDLHDRVAHSIAAGIQRVDLSGLANERLRQAVDLFDEALDETRSIALNLRHFVGEKRLDEAVRDYVVDLETGPATRVTSDGEAYRLPAGVQEEAFIIVREVIHNARRHSHADLVSVHLLWSPSGLEVVVRDDGRGFTHADVRPGAVGLLAAQERAELIGAELSLASEIGEGTVVTLAIPHREGAL